MVAYIFSQRLGLKWGNLVCITQVKWCQGKLSRLRQQNKNCGIIYQVYQLIECNEVSLLI